MADYSQALTQHLKSGEILTMLKGEVSKDSDLARIAAFNLVTEALKHIDEYRPARKHEPVIDITQSSDELNEAEKLLRDALNYYPQDFYATYLLAIVGYLQHPDAFYSSDWVALEKVTIVDAAVVRKEDLDPR